MTGYYLAILVPEETGGWTVLFPDLPSCATHGVTVQEAQLMASEAADLHLAVMHDESMPIPAARSLEAVRADAEWAEVDWSKVVISSIRVDRAS